MVIIAFFVQISLAIKQRKEAEEAHVCLAVMREDEARFRKALEQKRKEKHQVRGGEIRRLERLRKNISSFSRSC